MSLSDLSDTSDSIKSSFDHLASEIKSRSADRPVVYLQNPGNYGDALIHFGTMLFFDYYNIHAKIYTLNDTGEKIRSILRSIALRIGDKALTVYGGSGGWSDATYIAKRVVSINAYVNSNIIVLPSTYGAFKPPETVVAYARDRYESLTQLKEKRFCHDMAFFIATLDMDAVLPDRPPPDRKVGILFRVDNEARDHGFARTQGNRDLSNEGGHQSDAVGFLREVDRYETVLTDRLHVGIAATILGKDVLLSEGAYFKNRAIFDTSIRPYYSNCRLVKDDAMREAIARLA